MSSPRLYAVAKPSTLGVALSMQSALVRASLLARPAVKGSTHRRAA